MASGGGGCELIVWQKKEGKWSKEDQLKGHSSHVFAIDFSPLKDNLTMASGDQDGLIIIWQ